MSRVVRFLGMLLAGLFCTSLLATQAFAESAETGNLIMDWYIIDWAAYEIYFLLTPMSIACVALLIDYLINFRKDVVMPPAVVAQIETMFEQKDFKGVLEFTGNEPSMISYVIHNSLNEAGGGYSAMERAMNESVKEKVAMMMARCEISNIIGQLAPMVGLFGTVRSMILAFAKMEAAGGETSPAKAAAGGLRKAMVKTFWGLFIGTIGLAIYSFFRLHIAKLGNMVLNRSAEFLDVFKPGRTATAAPRGVGAPPAPMPRR